MVLDFSLAVAPMIILTAPKLNTPLRLWYH